MAPYHLMDVTPGSRLGPYEIVSRIGAGGMGEVFRANDTRLDRNVAIKVLPASVAHDPEFRGRFRREAKTISQLNHPHICQIYDVGEPDASSSDVAYLVMELLEGESLADRLARGGLSLPDVFRYGAQIAEALAAAHRAGIVHRDLKPGNIMLTKSGAKLLDFGLAKGAEVAPSALTVATGATEHKPLTAKGTILGTFQYMAPEQLEGLEADHRTDIFALGAVLYEMVTGKRAFEGKTKTSLIAAIVDRDPPAINSIQPLTPASLEHVIARCLAKDPDQRWQSASDVAAELHWIDLSDSREQVRSGRTRGKSRYILPLAVGLLLLLIAGLSFALYRARKDVARAREVVRFQIAVPAGSALAPATGTVSPDGRIIAMSVRAKEGNFIWIRRVGSAAAQSIPETRGGTFPFWSPDSQHLGFFADGKLKRVGVEGGASQVICDAPWGRGGTWSSDGLILFSPASAGPLLRVPASGGTPVEALPLDKAQRESSQRWPFFLPDNKHFLYSSRDGAMPGVYLASLDGKTRKRLNAADTSPWFARGHVLYVSARTLFAQPLDLSDGRLSGEPKAIAEEVGHDNSSGKSAFSASEHVLTTRSGTGDEFHLTWSDRSGQITGTVGPLGSYDHPDVSPDGKYVAVDRAERSGFRDVWIIDSNRGTTSRLTFDSRTDWIPAWSQDGQSIAFISDREGFGKLFTKVANGTQPDRKLIESDRRQHHFDWSADGRIIVTEQLGEKGLDLWMYELATGKGRPVVKSDFTEEFPRISPDGRWLAYSSDETGRSELYVLSLARDGGRWQISTDGGSGSRWRGDGRELFFFSRGRLMAVAISSGDTFEAGVPQPLFEPQLAYNTHGFDVTADGQRFLMPILDERASVSPINVVVNWAAAIQK